jgi:ribA/ribD-fused uncharacterized protein
MKLSSYNNREDDKSVHFYSVPYDAFNNWSSHKVLIWDKVFQTSEHAYHYRKFSGSDPEVAIQILEAGSPWAAKQIAIENKDKVGKDWAVINVAIMEELVRAKLEQHKDVQEALARTGSREIIEASPFDYFWGSGEDGSGKNMLGKIWMRLRDGQ